MNKSFFSDAWRPGLFQAADEGEKLQWRIREPDAKFPEIAVLRDLPSPANDFALKPQVVRGPGRFEEDGDCFIDRRHKF